MSAHERAELGEAGPAAVNGAFYGSMDSMDSSTAEHVPIVIGSDDDYSDRLHVSTKRVRKSSSVAMGVGLGCMRVRRWFRILRKSLCFKSRTSISTFKPSMRLRSEILKTVVAFVCLMMSAFLNFFLLTVIHDIIPTKPLPDLVFMLIPQQRWAWAVGDVLSTVSSVVGFAVILLHKDRLVVLRRVLLLGAIMYGLRAVVMGVTFLPTSFENREEICLPQVNRTAMYATEIATRFITYVVTLGLTSGQDKILCGDLMFSGHTVVLTIMYFTQLQYTPRGLVILRYIATPITFLGIAALVVSGGHYSMDVLIAYWLTSHVFWSYHQIFSMPRSERPNAPLSRVWWFWLCYWFEADVPEGPIVNEWNWPLPYPAVAHRWVALLNAKLQ